MNSVTPIDSGDPRLTAYVLGELTVSEAHAVEAWLIKSPETRAEVQGIREMIELIRGGFGAELEASLSAPVEEVPAFSVVRSPEQEFAAVGAARQRTLRRRFATVATGLAAAAAVTFAVITPNWKAPEGVSTPVAAELPPFSGSIPGLDHLGNESEGIFLASAGGLTPDLRSRPIGSDPVITEVRFLSGDPAELQNFPLTPEMVSYLPAPRLAAGAPSGGRSIYLDTDRYPNHEIVEAEAASAWDDQRFIPGFVASATTANISDGKSDHLKDRGRELFLAAEYEAAAVVLEKALRELSDTPDDLQIRSQIEALLNASRDMAAAGR
jgi:hypothetical protein